MCGKIKLKSKNGQRSTNKNNKVLVEVDIDKLDQMNRSNMEFIARVQFLSTMFIRLMWEALSWEALS